MKPTGPTGDYKNENYTHIRVVCTHTHKRARPYWVMSGRELTCYWVYAIQTSVNFRQAMKFKMYCN